jgi:polysaccharide deacetylase family protein (PEP-CTERM system associated)
VLTTQSIFSIDVEDWFHILDLPSTPDLEAWGALPSRVERNFRGLLELLAERRARATCFFLGWVAERFPHLVREALAAGHEVAAHGYAHRLVYTMSPRDFREDASRARAILEGISGGPVRGYRATGFSVTEATPWFFDELAEAGYSYDSSVFPAPRQHGGLRTAPRAPFRKSVALGEIVEFPVSVTSVAGRPLYLFGGGYLRLFPYPLVRAMARRVLSENRPVIYYVHPREIDPQAPRLPMGAVRRFKSYVNVAGTAGKIRRVLEDFEVTTFAGWLETHQASIEVMA